MTAVGVRLAVMEDDTVLCAECVHEYEAEGVPETAGTIVPEATSAARRSSWRTSRRLVAE